MNPADIVERLRKMARAIYITTDEQVANDISDGLTKAADEIERLRGVVEFLDALKGTMRSDALEEAAKVAEEQGERTFFEPYRDGSFGVNGVSKATSREIAAAIRALKSPVVETRSPVVETRSPAVEIGNDP